MALNSAFNSGHTEVLKLLLEEEAYIEAASNAGWNVVEFRSTVSLYRNSEATARKRS